jgi:hypothetical protein
VWRLRRLLFGWPFNKKKNHSSGSFFFSRINIAVRTEIMTGIRRIQTRSSSTPESKFPSVKNERKRKKKRFKHLILINI